MEGLQPLLLQTVFKWGLCEMGTGSQCVLNKNAHLLDNERKTKILGAICVQIWRSGILCEIAFQQSKQNGAVP